MNEPKLFASVALFKSLYDNNRDIYDVIAEFIKAALAIKNKWSFDSVEMKLLLSDLYEFSVPEAVVKAALKNKLVKAGVLKADPNGTYSVDSGMQHVDNPLDKQIARQQELQNHILSELYSYIENEEQIILTEFEKSQIFNTFRGFILANGYNDKYSQLISSFIIKNEDDTDFKNTLNAIKEGLIIYDGIRYSSASSLNDDFWKSNLTVYLSTEHLFNAVGYNGELYQQIFQDFFNLVTEVNRQSIQKNQPKKINLKYLPESKIEIDKFFYVAELIVQNKAAMDPSKAAMVAIVNGCKYKSDVTEKKASFLRALQLKGIVEEKEIEVLEYPEYNVVDQELLSEIERQIKQIRKEYDEEEVERLLKIFTKINILRRGKSSGGFENIGFIYLSGKTICHFLAHNTKVKFGEKDIPFSTDIDFITNKLWFKLKKGLGSSFTTPKSLDVSTKAKIILSSQINDSVSNKFNHYTQKFKLGEISKEDLIEYNNYFRERTSKPEDITHDNLNGTLAFLNDQDLSRYIEEKTLLRRQAEEGAIAIKELRRRDFLAKSEIKNRKKTRVTILYYMEFFIIYLLLMVGIFYFIYALVEQNDTKLAVIGLLISVLLIAGTALRKLNLHKHLKKRARARYQKYLATI